MGPSPISGTLVYSRIDPTKGPPCGVAHHQGSGTPTSKKVACGVMDVDAPSMGKQLGCVLEGAAALPALPVTEDWQSAALAPSPRSTNGPLAGAFVRDMTTSMGKQLGCVLEGGKLVPMEEFVGKVVPTKGLVKGLVPNEPLAGAFVNDMSSLGKQIGCVFDGA